MKIVKAYTPYLILVTCVLLSCTACPLDNEQSHANGQPVASLSTPTAAATGEAIVVDINKLRSHIEQLSHLQPSRSRRHPDSLKKAADYIQREFSRCTTTVEIQAYTVEGQTYQNVIASFGCGTGTAAAAKESTGEPGRIVVGAHYDVFRDLPGADDNGSGTAALLELGRLLHDLQPVLKRRIDLAAYTLEEPPYFRTPNMGSAVHAGSLKKAGVDVCLMISVDAIGYFSAEAVPDTIALLSTRPGEIVPGLSTVIAARTDDEAVTRNLQTLMQEKSGEIKVIALNLPFHTVGLDYSDHLNFWKEGYNALLITNFWIAASPYYHSAADTVEKIDLVKMSQIVRGLYWAIINFEKCDY